MLQERKGFFYEPELLDYKPVYARPDMNMMLKIIEAGAEKVAHQQDMLNKVQDKVRLTPTYLNQDTHYVADLTSKIDGEVSGMMDGTIDLLDPANSGKVVNIAKKYMYDPELISIAGRTGRINKSQEQIEAMRKAGKISAANYWEFNQSIQQADSEFDSSGKYNKDVKLHYDIVPYTDERAEKLETLSKIPLHTITTPIMSADGRWIHDRTIKAVNPEMARNIQYAKTPEEKQMYIDQNDRQLTALFLANMSEGARQQLIAEAKMRGATTEAQFQDYIQKSVLGVVDMANDADILDANLRDNPYKKMELEQAFQLRMLQAKIRADKEVAELENQRKLKAAKLLADAKDKEEGSGTPRATEDVTTVNYPQKPRYNLSPGAVTPAAIRGEAAKTAVNIKEFPKEILAANAKAKVEMDKVITALGMKQGFMSVIQSVDKNGKEVIATDPTAVGYKYVHTVPQMYLDKYPELRAVVESTANTLQGFIQKGKELQSTSTGLKRVTDELKAITAGDPAAENELSNIVKEVDNYIERYIASSFDLNVGTGHNPYPSEKQIDIRIKTNTGKSSKEEWRRTLIDEAVAKSKNPKLKEMQTKIDKTFNDPISAKVITYTPNYETGQNAAITRVEGLRAENDMLNRAITNSSSVILDANGKRIDNPVERKKIVEQLNIKSEKTDEADLMYANKSYSYAKYNGDWYMIVSVTGETSGQYQIQLSSRVAKTYLSKIGIESQYNYNATQEVMARAGMEGKAIIQGTDAEYDPNPVNILGNTQAQLTISGQSIPYSIELTNVADIEDFYAYAKSNIGDGTPEKQKEDSYITGLIGLGFNSGQAQIIVNSHPEWLK
jgi:hypothetical protein